MQPFPTFIECRSRTTAKRRASWAVVIAKCEGGFIAFDSYDSYRTWKRQR